MVKVAVWVTVWPVADCPVATAVLVPQMAGTSTGSSIDRVVADRTVTVNDTVPPPVATTTPTTTPLTVLVTGGGLTNPHTGVKTMVKVWPMVNVPANWLPVQLGNGFTTDVSPAAPHGLVAAGWVASPL